MSYPVASLAIRLAAVSMALAAAVSLQAAEPAQIPLASRVAEPPTPNVMLTIDDSGSMLADFMPEGTFTFLRYPTKSIELSRDWVGGFPGDLRKLNGSSPTGNYLEGVVTSNKGSETVNQMQYRSPDVNAIYYNPDLRYEPWYKPDGSGRMANATPSAARWDPVISAGTFNLSKNYTGGSKITTIWYTAPGTKKSESRDFYPGLVYRLKIDTDGVFLDAKFPANYVRYDILALDGSHAPATKHANRLDCAGTKCTQAEELQNLANWFTYYRMRESLTKAAVSESLVAFKDKLRVGWGRINKSTKDTIDGVGFKVIETAANGGPVRPLDGTRLKTVLTGVQSVSSWPSTPLRTSLDEVGRYFDVAQRGATGSPWLTDPGNSSSAKLACRRSVSLLMTDGYYNDTYSGAGNVDGVNGPNYTGSQNPNNYSPTQYKAERPFIDGPPAVSDTLADVAAKYYVKDLDSTIANKVWPTLGDIAYWQHLTQFMVGLGVKGTLDSSAAKKADTLVNLKSGAAKWPDPNKGSPEKIDDMWHAAVNSGGDFYSVANVTQLTDALKDAFGRAAGNESKEAGVATASDALVANNVKYVPKYKSVSWYGDLEAWQLGTDGKDGNLLWKAGDHLPAQALRNLFTWDATSKTSVPFTWTGMGTDNKTRVGAAGVADYIRGDTTNEGTGKTYRARDSKLLGDFVDSPPVVVKGMVDLGYSAFDASYTTYLAAKKARPDALVVVGGNAGIAHGFRASDGVEVYGYLPREGLPNLSKVAAKDYGTTGNFHKFFVDGPMNETDAFIKPPGAAAAAWTNIVIGAMGGGGKAFFAMHVPTDFGATLDATDFGVNTLMWEKSGTSDPDIGYMFADFAVGKIKGGGWKAFVGNGVYSTNGNAVLLVVNMEDGVVEKKMTVATGGTGLMGVTLIKDDLTQEVVGAYAGDLTGNLWRFDFEGAGVGDWKVGFGGKPLFVATDAGGARQPITVPPVFVPNSIKGRVVLFGTGRLIDEADADKTQVQTYYGVWDNVKVGDSSASATSPFSAADADRLSLQVQVIDKDHPKTDKNGTYYEVKTTAVNWDTQLGWLVELPWDRQRVIYPSMILSDSYVYFSTIVPASKAAECDVSSGVGYNFLLVAESGTEITVPIFDTNGDGLIDSSDLVVGGFQSKSDGTDDIVWGGNPDDDGSHGGGDPKACVGGFHYLNICSTETECKLTRLPCDMPPPLTHVIKDRVWKQILTPPQPD